MPAAFNTVWRNALYDWCYEGEPGSTLNNRRILQPRGKVLGGSLSINGMCFIQCGRKLHASYSGNLGRYNVSGLLTPRFVPTADGRLSDR